MTGPRKLTQAQRECLNGANSALIIAGGASAGITVDAGNVLSHILAVEAERDVALAQAATLREWIEHASDFLDEIWIEYQSGSAVYEGASRLLHSGLPLLADTAAAAAAHDAAIVERCARLMAGYLSVMPGNTDEHPEDLLAESMRVLKQGVTP